MNNYPHTCRDGHPEIGHRDSESEMCPLCRVKAELDLLRASFYDCADYIGEVVEVADTLHHKAKILNEMLEKRAEQVESL